MTSALNSSSTRARASADIFLARVLSPSTVSMLRARAGASLGGTRRPVVLSDIISGTPPTLLATTGVPDAIASKRVMGKLSEYEGSMNREARG